MRAAQRLRRARPQRPRSSRPASRILSKELTITTPHYVLTVGEETTRFLLGKLFKNRPYEPGDSLELQLFDNPAFKVVPVATPAGAAAARPQGAQGVRGTPARPAQVMGL